MHGTMSCSGLMARWTNQGEHCDRARQQGGGRRGPQSPSMGFDERAAAGATATRARLHTASAIKPFHRALCMLVCSLTLLRVVHSAVVALFALSLSATRRSGSRPTVATWPGKGVRCLLVLLALVGAASAQPAASVQVPASVQCAGNCSASPKAADHKSHPMGERDGSCKGCYRRASQRRRFMRERRVIWRSKLERRRRSLWLTARQPSMKLARWPRV